MIFETTAKDVRTLEQRITRRLSNVLGRDVPVFIRSFPELKRIAAREPFGRRQRRDASVNVILLSENLDPGRQARLMALRTKTDRFSVRGREVYWWRLTKPGTSLFATVPFAKVLCEPFTIRSSNTIRRLVAKWR